MLLLSDSIRPMNQRTRNSLMLLAATGLVSAVLTLVAPFKTNFAEFTVGSVFGVAVAVYFVFYEGHHNPAKIAAFVCVCTAAFPLSEFVAFRLVEIFRVNGSMGSARLDIPMPVFFGAGCMGALPILAGGMFLFGPRNISWASLGKVLLWSLGGGFLGVVGGGADGILTQGTYNKMRLLFIIWQPGAALLLGLLLIRDREALAMPSTVGSMGRPTKTLANRGVLLVAGAFFACVLGFLGYLVFRTVQSQRMIARRDAAYKRFLAEAPPIVGVPRLEPVTLEQAVIDREIGGLYPWLPMSRSSGQLSAIQPPSVAYSIGYTTMKDPPIESLQRIVAVTVTQLPSGEWARYRIKYPEYPGANPAINSPQSLTNVTKFGQTIVQDASMRYPNGGGTLCFHWPSGNFAISVCYERPEIDEEFLRKYLEKYPSSL